jgi:small subunit ribosomal protein S17
LLSLKKEQFNLRFQKRDRPAREDLTRGQVRKDIARIKTIAAPRSGGKQGLRTEMPKRILQGVVVSDKNDKTVVVKVERRFRTRSEEDRSPSKKYKAHDENNAHKVGDRCGSRNRSRFPS